MSKDPNTPDEADFNDALESDIFSTFSELINAKEEIVRDNITIHDLKETVRAFVNQLPTLTEEEKKCEGRSEATNFGSTFRAAQVNIAPLESMVTGTDALVKVIVDTDHPERDAIMGTEMTNLINDGIFNESDRFDHLWRTIVGEGYVIGGGALVWDDQDSTLFPRYARHLLFPKNTPIYSKGVTQAFEKREMSISDLQTLKARFENDNDYLNHDAIDKLIEGIRSNLSATGSDTTLGSTDEFLSKDAVRNTKTNVDPTLDVWTYWEVRFEDEEQFVSEIVFIDGVNATFNEQKSSRAIIAQDKKAFDNANEWLVFIAFDEEIGGEKTVDTLRGLAEASYPASVMVEELLNLQIEGAMMVAKPTLLYNDTIDPDEALDFRLGDDLFAPQGVQDFLNIPNQTGQFNPIVAQLIGNVAGINAADRANTGRGQELRQQAVERQANSTIVQTNRIAKAYKKLDRILTIIVGRLLTLDPPKGTQDSNDFRWFQDCIDRKIVKVYKLEDESKDGEFEYSRTALNKASEIRKEIAAKLHGRFKNLRIRANRAATGFDRVSEEENAEFLLNLLNTGLVPSQLIPSIMKTAITLKTQNPDIAELAVADPKPISNDQQERAAYEWGVIMNRASTGEVYPISPNDIHEDHIISHLVDMIGLLQRHPIKPWDEVEVMQLYGAAEHISLHFQEMQRISSQRDYAGQLYSQFQELLGNATTIIQQLEAEAQEQAAQEPDDVDTELKRAKAQQIAVQTQLAIQKFGLEQVKESHLQQQRDRRDEQQDERIRAQERATNFSQTLQARKLQIDALKLGRTTA